MSKPDWKDAPDWAQWLAMDGDGLWSFYEHKPEWGIGAGEWWIGEDSPDETRWAQFGGPDETGIDWDHAFDTLEQRP